MKRVSLLRMVRRTVECEIAYRVSRLRVLERLAGNPGGIAIRQLAGGAVALMARELAVPSFNGVAGLRAGHEQEIEGLAAWYRAEGVPAQFEIVPAYYDWALGRELARLYYYQSGLHAALVCEPRLHLPTPAAGIAIERIASRAALDALEVFAAGSRGLAVDDFKANVLEWLGPRGRTLYLARLHGKPAATAILYIADKVGYCAEAAIDPAVRRRGLGTALLDRLIADASAAGVDFVCSGAALLSEPQRIMERAGMRVLFVRGLWTAL